jgi:hypothetical protein
VGCGRMLLRFRRGSSGSGDRSPTGLRVTGLDSWDQKQILIFCPKVFIAIGLSATTPFLGLLPDSSTTLQTAVSVLPCHTCLTDSLSSDIIRICSICLNRSA